MIINDTDYTIDCNSPGTAKLLGTLRLPSPTAYDEPFSHIKSGIDSSSEYTIDVTELEFLNSSGLTAIARLFMHARKCNTPLTIIANESTPWQKKSLVSLKMLWDQITIELQ